MQKYSVPRQAKVRKILRQRIKIMQKIIKIYDQKDSKKSWTIVMQIKPKEPKLHTSNKNHAIMRKSMKMYV